MKRKEPGDKKQSKAKEVNVRSLSEAKSVLSDRDITIGRYSSPYLLHTVLKLPVARRSKQDNKDKDRRFENVLAAHTNESKGLWAVDFILVKNTGITTHTHHVAVATVVESWVACPSVLAQLIVVYAVQPAHFPAASTPVLKDLLNNPVERRLLRGHLLPSPKHPANVTVTMEDATSHKARVAATSNTEFDRVCSGLVDGQPCWFKAPSSCSLCDSCCRRSGRTFYSTGPLACFNHCHRESHIAALHHMYVDDEVIAIRATPSDLTPVFRSLMEGVAVVDGTTQDATSTMEQIVNQMEAFADTRQTARSCYSQHDLETILTESCTTRFVFHLEWDTTTSVPVPLIFCRVPSQPLRWNKGTPYHVAINHTLSAIIENERWPLKDLFQQAIAHDCSFLIVPHLT